MSGKKRRAEAHPPLEKDESEVRWLISYSDFMMQLVCLFILLYSVSVVDVSKAVPFEASWREHMGLEPLVTPEAPEGGKLPPLTMADLSRTLGELEVSRGHLTAGRHIRVSATSEGFRLQLGAEMFNSSSGRLTLAGTELLDQALTVLMPYRNRVEEIEIVGHASAGEREEGSALRLSLTRAREAYKWVTRREGSNRLPEAVLTASGHGARDPVADNRGEAGGSANRRVDFVVRLAPAR